MKFFFLSSFAHLVLDPKSERISGGAELQVALLGQALAGMGHEVVFIGSDMPEESVANGISLMQGGRFHTGRLWDTALAFPSVVRALIRERPDFAIILGWTTWLYFLLRLRPFFGYRLIFICGLDTEVNGEFRRAHPIRGALFEKAVRAADIRYAMSEHQVELFQRSGLNCSFYRNLILPRTAPRTVEKKIDLLWVARCQPIKRPHLFLDLAEQLPAARCYMVCPRENGRLWESVQKRAATLPNVIFVERVPYHWIQKHYDAAKIFVNTSTYEGWPNSFIQAGLGATALLSLDINPDGLFNRYQLGRYADGDFQRLVDYAREMLANPTALSLMQQQSEQFVIGLHNNENNVRLFLNGLQSFWDR